MISSSSPWEHKLASAKSRILGARHGDFIVVDNPTLDFCDRLFSKFSGRIECKYILNGEVYGFLSRVRMHNVKNVKGTICSTRMTKLGKRTELGIKFLDPASELEEIAGF